MKYEVMDGSPNRGETVPIRIFLAGYDLQPTMRDIAKKFSVKLVRIVVSLHLRKQVLYQTYATLFFSHPFTTRICF